MLTDEKFCDAALKFLLLKDTEGHYYTPEEYRTLVEPEQIAVDVEVALDFRKIENTCECERVVDVEVNPLPTPPHNTNTSRPPTPRDITYCCSTDSSTSIS